MKWYGYEYLFEAVRNFGFETVEIFRLFNRWICLSLETYDYMKMYPSGISQALNIAAKWFRLASNWQEKWLMVWGVFKIQNAVGVLDVNTLG